MDRLSRYLARLKNCHFFAIDAVVFLVTPALALIIRLDGSTDLASYLSGLAIVTVLFLVVKLVCLSQFGFYKHCWRYASIDELTQLTLMMAAAIVLQTLLFKGIYYFVASPIHQLPRSLPLLDGLLSFLIIGGTRFSIRAVERIGQRRQVSNSSKRTLIIGAGNAGVSLVQEMQRNPQFGYYPVAFIDDAPQKLNLRIRGVPVLGDRGAIPDVTRRLNIDRIVIAIPSISGSVIRDIAGICQKTGVQTCTLPGIHQILNGRVSVNSLRELQIEDLLRREPIQTDVQRVCQLLAGKTVLVTGAGGSIGSELCRQILKFSPAEVVLLGKGENSVFMIQQELEKTLQTLKQEDKDTSIPRMSLVITDIRSQARLEHVFERFRPEVVFHAAAHKHVPLMELNPPEAITCNVVGTRNLVELALRYEVNHFVMISTDKAVNPTSVMGASKRVAELLVLQAARKSGRPFVVVRFGNVLGSRGSVIPTFQRQIATGGPITVTHPDICRYFMTIPEAVQLVLQASVISRGGEVCMLDMGQPVKIVDLAKDVIRLSGYETGKDIDIVFTGLRPGEKLFEELFIEGECYERTQHEKIIVAQNASSNIPDNLEKTVEMLCDAATRNNIYLILFLLEQLVSGYTPHYSDDLWKTQNSRTLTATTTHCNKPLDGGNKRSNNILQTQTTKP